MAAGLAARRHLLRLPAGDPPFPYTTNALGSVHARLRRILETHGHFPTDDAATKLPWPALRDITAGWWTAAHYWHLARGWAPLSIPIVVTARPTSIRTLPIGPR